MSAYFHIRPFHIMRWEAIIMCDELTISSIEVQQFCCLYSLEEAFAAGTIFRELDKPFTGVCGCE